MCNKIVIGKRHNIHHPFSLASVHLHVLDWDVGDEFISTGGLVSLQVVLRRVETMNIERQLVSPGNEDELVQIEELRVAKFRQKRLRVLAWTHLRER